MKYTLTLIIFLILLCSNAWATDYYVDADAADDTGTGLVGDPWKTIDKVNSEYQAGTFAYGDQILFEKSDTWTLPVWGSSGYYWLAITNAGPTGTGSTTNRLRFGSYGAGADPIIQFAGGAGDWQSAIKISGDYIEIDGLHIKRGMIYCQYMDYGLIENCTLEGMVRGISLYSHCTNNEIRYNIVDAKESTYEFLANEGIQLGTSSGPETTTHNEVHHNIVKGWSHAQINTTYGTDNTIYSNYVYDIGDGHEASENYAAQGSEGFRVQGIPLRGTNNTFYNNWIETIHYEPMGGQNNFIYGNVFNNLYNATPIYPHESSCIIFLSDNSNLGSNITGNIFSNNIIYNAVDTSSYTETAAFRIATSGGFAHQITGNEISNNIILEWDLEAGNGMDFALAIVDDHSNDNTRGNTFRNNSFYRTGGAEGSIIRDDGTSYTVSDWDTADPHGNTCSGNITTDPGLSDAAGGDFWASSDASNIVDAGIDVGDGYILGLNQIGTDFGAGVTIPVVATLSHRDYGPDNNPATWVIGPYVQQTPGQTVPNMTLQCKFDDGALLREEISDTDAFWTNNGTVDQNADSQQGDRSADFDDAVPEWLSRAGTTDDFGIGTNGAFTICGWIKSHDLTSQADILCKGLSANNEAAYVMKIKADDTVSCYLGWNNVGTANAWEEMSHNTAITVNQWYWVCWAHTVSTKANLIRIWSDTGDVLLGSDYTTASTNTMTGHVLEGDLSIGAGTAGANSLDGQIDKFVGYDRALTADDMDQARTENWDSSTFTNSTAPAATYSTVGDTVTITVTTSVEAFIENGIPYAALETGVVDAIAYYTGKTSTTQTYVATLTAGMRSTDLVWKDASITLPSGCTMTNAADQAFTLTLPDAGAITNTTVIAIPGFFTICSSGCTVTGLNGELQVNEDVWNYTEDKTENLTITADQIIIQGSGYTLTGTVTFNAGADNNTINCLNISGAVTDNGTGNVVREYCPVSNDLGPKNFSPFF